MIKLLINEYYRWGTVDIVHLLLTISVVVLSHVVFAEPTLMTVSAIMLALTYFFIKVKSRFSYVLNIASTATLGYLFITSGAIITGVSLLAIMVPIGIVLTWYIYRHQIYPSDYAARITNAGFLSIRHSMLIIGMITLFTVGGGYLVGFFGLSIYPFLDVGIITMFLTSITLVYFSKYEHTITYTIFDTLNLLFWLLVFINTGVGISMIIVTLLVFGRSRLLLIWWIAKTFKVIPDGVKIST